MCDEYIVLEQRARLAIPMASDRVTSCLMTLYLWTLRYGYCACMIPWVDPPGRDIGATDILKKIEGDSHPHFMAEFRLTLNWFIVEPEPGL